MPVFGITAELAREPSGLHGEQGGAGVDLPEALEAGRQAQAALHGGLAR